MTTEKIAVLFPGQGSQFIGMGREFAKADAEAMTIFEMADAICGKDLQTLCFEGPIENLTLAVNLQPAITAVNLACWQAVKKAGVPVDFVAGHSLGEYAALHAANVLSLEDTLRMVAHRGRIMNQAGEKNPGGMVAILGLGLSDVQKILTSLACPESISIANYNSEQQLVLSGSAAALQQATELATAQGGKAVPLNVSIANHSPLMSSALPEFAEIFAGVTLSPPSTPIFFNVTANTETDVELIRTIMAQQIVSMVRWYEIINNLMDRQVRTFIEVGPKKVLTGLMKRILPKDGGHRCFQIESPETLAQCLDKL
ncbi:MAG: ACP S-malonyltransferase [Desulfobulbaceae bacterium]|nr:ACP S-malonyltransferase [Desulfobulbaceae bacterium]